MTTTILGVSFDTNDAVAIATFWAGALGRTVNEGASETFAAVAVGDGSPVLMFHKVPEPKTVKNRLHFDLKTSDFTAESERLLGLGATQLTTLADNGGNWVTFADPDGNEFDLIPG
jgi:predicted enzyme related to lactoylglutathione lyase